MGEIRNLIRLLRKYFPRNWEFGSDLSKLRNFGMGVGLTSLNTPRHATGGLPNEILDQQHKSFLTHCPGVDACCIALSSKVGGLRMDNAKMKGPRFDY
jgi:hypothetical protein